MSRVGDKHLGASVVTAALVVSADNHQSGKLAVSSCHRVEGEVIETSELREHLTQFRNHSHRALAGEVGL